MPTFLIGKRAKITAAIAIAVVCLFLPDKPVQASNRITGYLWSATAGWISMSCDNGGTCGTSDYGVEFGLLEEDTAKISGFAWSENLGWICFGETCDTLTDSEGNFLKNPENTDFNYAELVLTDGVDGQLYGWARLVNEGSAGWISLNCDNRIQKVCPDPGTGQYYYVAFDASEGLFCLEGECEDPSSPALAFPSHWAWSGNTGGTGIGWVDWSLAETDWVPSSIASVLRPQGIFEPEPAVDSQLPGTHPSDYVITVEGVYAPEDYMLRCDVIKSNGERKVHGQVFSSGPQDGSDVDLVGTISTADGIRHGNPSEDAIQFNSLWYIDGCYLAAEPSSTPCFSDSDCGFGDLCDSEVSGGANECRPVVVQTGKKPFYVHHNDWTLFGLEEDFYQAVKCYTQFEDEFFRNSARCNFYGDAILSMAMNRGIPIERNCVNGLDDDGNEKFDCDDPFCQSLSVDCISHPALGCDWEEATGTFGRCESIQYKPGDFCCTRQNRLVSGLECIHKDNDDGYYDCDDPAYTPGDLCCTANNDVIKAAEPE